MVISPENDTIREQAYKLSEKKDQESQKKSEQSAEQKSKLKKSVEKIKNLSKISSKQNQTYVDSELEKIKLRASDMIENSNIKKAAQSSYNFISCIGTIPKKSLEYVNKSLNYAGDIIDSYFFGDNRNQKNKENTAKYSDLQTQQLEKQDILVMNKNAGTDQTDQMISHSEVEINMLDQVINIFQNILQMYVTCDKYTDKFIQFLQNEINYIKNSLYISKEYSIGLIKNIDNFNRKELKNHKLIERYNDEIKNTFIQYKNGVNVFNNPIIEVKNKIIKYSNINPNIIRRLVINDLWINELINKVYLYLESMNSQNKINKKELDMIFKITICAICSVNLSMYGITNSIKDQTNNFFNNSI